jgi:hypothetical protein
MEIRARPVGGIKVNKVFTMATDFEPVGNRSQGRRQSFDGSLYFFKGMTEKYWQNP